MSCFVNGATFRKESGSLCRLTGPGSRPPALQVGAEWNFKEESQKTTLPIREHPLKPGVALLTPADNRQFRSFLHSDCAGRRMSWTFRASSYKPTLIWFFRINQTQNAQIKNQAAQQS